jgi:hypothetical protein
LEKENQHLLDEEELFSKKKAMIENKIENLNSQLNLYK